MLKVASIVQDKSLRPNLPVQSQNLRHENHHQNKSKIQNESIYTPSTLQPHRDTQTIHTKQQEVIKSRSRRTLVDESDGPTSLRSKFHLTEQQQQPVSTSKNKEPLILSGAKGRRLRKLMIEQKSCGMMRRKDVVEAPEVVEERNEVIEKRCCICLEEMLAKTRPEECRHVFCRTCITAWTNTFSNLCPLCKVEIKFLLIFKEKTPAEMDECEEYINDYEEQEDVIVDKIAVAKPVINDELSDWVESFADNCYVCERGTEEQQLLVCDRCNFNICHTFCCNLDSIPEGDWFCRDCTAEYEQEQKDKLRRRITRQRASREVITSSSDDDEDEEEEPHASSMTSILNNTDLYNQSDEEDQVVVQQQQGSRVQQIESQFVTARDKSQRKADIKQARHEREQSRHEELKQSEQSSSLEESPVKFKPKVIKPKPVEIVKSRRFTIGTKQFQNKPEERPVMQSQKQVLHSFIPPFKTYQFGPKIRMSFDTLPSCKQLVSEGLTKSSVTSRKSCFKKQATSTSSSDDNNEETPTSVIRRSEQIPISESSNFECRILQIDQGKDKHKKGISFKEPTPAKIAIALALEKRHQQMTNDFDDIQEVKHHPSITAGTTSASKAVYGNIIDKSDIHSLSIRNTQQPANKKLAKRDLVKKRTQKKKTEPKQSITKTAKKQAKKKKPSQDSEEYEEEQSICSQQSSSGQEQVEEVKKRRRKH